MAYEKLKSENFRNLQGINSKVSQYATDQQEFLDLSNFDFQTPASLSKRPGSTQYLSTGVSGRILGIFEHEQLSGASYITFAANTRLYFVQSNAGTAIQSGLQDNSLMAFQTFVDRLFFCNGANFMKWKGGATPYLFSLPQGPSIAFDLATGASSAVLWANATMSWTVGWVNERGFYGRAGYNSVTHTTNPVIKNIYFQSADAATGITTVTGATIIYYNIPASYGIGFGLTMPFWNGCIGVCGTTLPDGYTFVTAGMAIYQDSGPGTPRFRKQTHHYFNSVAGVTFLSASSDAETLLFHGPGAIPNDIATTFPEPTCLHFTMFPRWMEIYNNQLFMAGLSATPSVVWFSEIGEPETVEPTFNFEVRTNDGDRVSGLKQYFSQLVIFKERSFHVLSGDNPSNFSVRQISDQYGCLSGRAITSFENNLLFLDKKGVALYNGANVSIISNKVEPVFTAMNIDAAKDNACMIHNRLKNQVWIGIPINGATLNNCTVVYDYLLNSWTKYEGYNPSSLAVIKGYFTQPTAAFGSYASGSIFYFNASFMGDNGAGFTCFARSRFVADLGEGAQTQFRRLYNNFTPVAGASVGVALRFYQDFGASIVYSSTMPITSFQTRIDFGIPARSLSFDLTHYSEVDPLVWHGFVLSYRFQRNV